MHELTGEDDLCQFAMDLFFEAGQAESVSPIYKDHSSTQTVFFDFDNSVSLSLSDYQRLLLDRFTDVSYLFFLDDDAFKIKRNRIIKFYSAELIGTKSMRSQLAYDIHYLLHPLTGSYASVFLFKSDDMVMISIMTSHERNVLSDWYSVTTDADGLMNRLGIESVSLQSAHSYIEDLAYNVGRGYYIYPRRPEMALYTYLPTDYFVNPDYAHIDRDDTKEFINKVLYEHISQYGDDYIEKTHDTENTNSSINREVDLLLLSIDEDEDQGTDNLDNKPFNEEQVDSQDEYDFGDVDPEIFKDPTLMVKWLEKHDQSNE